MLPSTYYRFKRDARNILAREGVKQVLLASLAGTNRHHLNRNLRGKSNVRGVTAWKIARAFKQLSKGRMTEHEALQTLFDVVIEERHSPLVA